MIENTLENKAKFFAQYYSQKVLRDQEGFYFMEGRFLPTIDANCFLELKRLSSITDEKLKILCDFIGLVNVKIDRIEKSILVWDDSYHIIIDHDGINMYYRGKVHNQDDILINDVLRSFGIARNWMGLSVEKQIEYGWIKLSE